MRPLPVGWELLSGFGLLTLSILASGHTDMAPGAARAGEARLGLGDICFPLDHLLLLS